MIASTLAAGFALAAHPILAQVITTDTKGLVAGTVKIPVNDGEIPAYRAMPAKGNKFPTVLVIVRVEGIITHSPSPSEPCL